MILTTAYLGGITEKQFHPLPDMPFIDWMHSLMVNIMKSVLKDLTGKTFGRLTVVDRAADKGGKRKRVAWNCKCSCGNARVVLGEALRRAQTRSCGCLRREVTTQRHRDSHGKSYVCGVGINDTDCTTEDSIYYVWVQMLRRCYVPKVLLVSPTYAQCTVDPDWHFFSMFKEWAEAQGNITGRELDKDILVPGNQHYSETTCAFVTPEMNRLLSDKYNVSSRLPQGVGKHIKNLNFVARLRIDGKTKHLGCFDTPEAASFQYARHKAVHLLRVAAKEADTPIREGLISHAQRYLVSAQCQDQPQN